MTGTKKPAAPPTPSFVCSCGGCLPADGVISRPRATCSTHHYPVGVILAVCEPRRPGLDLVVSDNAVCAESSGTKLGVGGAHSCVSGASRASAPQVRPWTCFCLVVLTHGTRPRDALGVRCPRNNSTERRSMLGCTVKCSANMGRATGVNSVLLVFVGTCIRDPKA